MPPGQGHLYEKEGNEIVEMHLQANLVRVLGDVCRQRLLLSTHRDNLRLHRIRDIPLSCFQLRGIFLV